MTDDQSSEEEQIAELRNQLRVTFNQDAALYDQARPVYPAAMLDDIVALSGIPAGGRILEIGPGTGQVTLPWAQRGYQILAIELGEAMAAVAQRKLAAFPSARIHIGSFEEWPVEAGAFDLVFSATAFHWVDPAFRYRKTALALRPGGAIALCWNKHVQNDASGGFFELTQPFYRQAFPDEPDDPLQWPHELAHPEADEIEQSGLYGDVAVRTYAWQQEYDTASYLNLLNTYSNHRNLPLEQRQRLLNGIGGLIERQYGGRITKGYLTLLCCARRQ